MFKGALFCYLAYLEVPTSPVANAGGDTRIDGHANDGTDSERYSILRDLSGERNADTRVKACFVAMRALPRNCCCRSIPPFVRQESLLGFPTIWRLASPWHRRMPTRRHEKMLGHRPLRA